MPPKSEVNKKKNPYPLLILTHYVSKTLSNCVSANTYGQYVNGDYWVLGPVSIIDIDPPSYSSETAPSYTGVDIRYLNGSMVNPRGGINVTGFDNGGRHPETYRHELNVAWEVDEESPLVLEPGSSLISSISHWEPESDNPLETAAVLTVVETAPVPEAFRPPFVGTDKSMPYTLFDVEENLHKLQDLVPVGSPPDWSTVERYVERPHLDFWAEWTRSNVTPTANAPNYGRNYQMRMGAAILMLNMDYSVEDKLPTLIGVIQTGLDLFSFYRDYLINPDATTFLWDPNGGHSHGRYWPILFSGHMLAHPEMMAIGETNDVTYEDGDAENGAPSYASRRFQENAQTFIVRPYDVGRTLNDGNIEYEAHHVGMPEWGIRHSTRPEQDNSDWGQSYRRNENGATYQATALAAMAMGLREAWNHEPFFLYTDRYMLISGGEPYLNENGEQVEVPNEHAEWRCWPAYQFACDMWDAYRSDY